MFATLLGALPGPMGEADDEDPVVTAIRAQEAAGLEPVTDGRLGDAGFDRLAPLLTEANGTDDAVTAVLAAWQAAAAAATRAAKQALPGPYSLGLRPGVEAAAREGATLAAAEELAEIVAALAKAGCPLVEIEEDDVRRLEDDAERRLYREAHRRLTETGHGGEIHRSLSITGGSVPKGAIEAVLEAPYSSLAVDLIAGPDNWYVVRQATSERGVIAGVLSAGEVDEAKEVMHWGAHYAASSGGRGRDRVGLGSAGSWANLTWAAALRKLGRLGEAARLAAMPPGEELAQSLDPRAASSRRAALGHGAAPQSPKPRTRRNRP